MRSLLGRFHRPMSRGLVNNMLTMNNLGDGSTLSLDFTTMGDVLDPRLTFSRASTATFVNSSGYVEYAAHNLYYNTNFATITTGPTNPSLTSKGWSYVFSTGTAVFNTDGSVSMAAVGNRVGLLRSAGFAGTGRRLIFSVDITSVGDTGLPPSQLVNEGTKTNDAYYIDGTLWTSGNVVGPCTLSFVFTSNPAGNAATYFGIGMSGNATGIVTFANPRWGLYGGVNQLAYSPNTSATNANYLTAEYHAPRFDYSPTNIGEPRGLLIEGQTANLLFQSNDWNTTWNIPAPITWNGSTYATAPNNTNTAKQITVTAGASAAIGQAVTTGTNRTISVWLRGGSLTSFSIGAFDAGGTSWGNNVDSTCSIISGPGAATQQVGGLWSITGLSTTQWTRIQIFRSSTYTTFLAYPGASSGTINGTAFMWGMQMEAGSGASSYIPTGASQVTRTSESCTISGTNFSSWFTQGEGTLYAYSDVIKSNNRNLVARIENAGATNYIEMGLSAVGYATEAVAYAGGAFTSLGSAYTPVVNVPYKSAYTWSNGRLNLGANGTTPTAVSATLVTDLICIGIGGGFLMTDTYLRNGHIRQLKYYPMVMTNAQLQTLTAP